MKHRRNLTFAAQRKRRRRLIGTIAVLSTVLTAMFFMAVILLRTGGPYQTHVQVGSGEPTPSRTIVISQASDLPNSNLTPGVAAESDIRVICQSGYATSVRPRGSLWNRLKDEAYNRYGIPRGHRSAVDDNGVHHPAYEVDHLIPLELGGAPSDIRNLWPESIAGAKEKDKVENKLHTLVCSGRLSLRQAQNAIAQNWKAAVPGRAIP